MKALKILLTALVAVSLLSTCEQTETPQPEIQEKLVEIVLLSENSHLQGLVESFNSTPNGRTKSLLDKVDFSRSMKRVNPETGNTHYSFSISSENELYLRKFILTENDNSEVFGHVFEYEVDADWYVQLDTFPGWDQYNGYFRIFNLDGKIIAENKMVNGSSENTISSNGRTNITICTTTTWRVDISVSAMPELGSHTYYETATTCMSYLNPTRLRQRNGGGGSTGPQVEVFVPDDGGVGSFSPSACAEGYVRDENGTCVQEKPCKKDPVPNPEIVPTKESGKKGGTFGCTRIGNHSKCEPGKKYHDGLDIKANVNESAFAMYSGRVSSIRNSFTPGEYKDKSYGNYVIITSVINGSTYHIKYNHLNTVSVA